ncbi:hypothetical protein M2138_001503 [Dysgonomonadaceae bacterium PH5-43]|nr:hypothetical protein [Dysgonomonadaceae bacterium PH5-43]
MKKTIIFIVALICCLPICLQAQEKQKKQKKQMQFAVVDSVGNIKVLNEQETKAIHLLNLKEAMAKGDVSKIIFCPPKIANEFFSQYKPVIIPEYFLLGALGSQKITPPDAKGTEIKDMKQYPAYAYLKNCIKETTGKDAVFTKIDNLTYKFYSPELALLINDFFDNNNELDMSKFNSQEEICSYLLGVYFDGGEKKNDVTYRFPCVDIRGTKIDNVFSLLRKSYSNNIKYSSSSLKGAIPGSAFIYFEPLAHLKNYLDSIETTRAQFASDIDRALAGTIFANAAPASKPATAPINNGAEYDNGETP